MQESSSSVGAGASLFTAPIPHSPLDNHRKSSSSVSEQEDPNTSYAYEMSFEGHSTLPIPSLKIKDAKPTFANIKTSKASSSRPLSQQILINARYSPFCFS
jgi:hypothetical protein